MSAGQRQLALDDDQLLALAKLLHTMTERNMLAFANDGEYRAYVGAVSRVNAAAEDVINESRLTRRPDIALTEAERTELRARFLAIHKPHDSETGATQ